MSTTAKLFADGKSERSVTSAETRIDRWIYVFMAASFIAIVLTGFIPGLNH